MYYDFLVKIPAKKGKIFERTIKGVTYIIIREVTALTINNAYYKLVEELRSMGSHY